VAAFGRYAIVVAMVTIAGGVADAGLSVVGQREYVRAAPAARPTVLAAVASLRLVLAPAGVLLAALFALAAGFPGELVVGTLIAGAGVVCSSLAVSLALPLAAELRLGLVAATELARQAALAVAIVVLVALGARLPALFAAQLVAGVAMLVATAVAVRGRIPRPRLDRATWALAGQAAGVGLALVIGIVHVRVLVVLVFLLGTSVETGLFGASARVLELVGAVPWLLVGSAFPVLAAAGGPALARGLRRLAEGGLYVAGVLAVGIGLGAEVVIRVLGGDAFAGAADVLRIQCALIPLLFLTQTWASGLVALGRHRALVLVNASGLVAVLALGAALIPVAGASGAAVAAVAAEALLAALTGAALAREGVRPWPPGAWRPLVAAAAGIGVAVASGLAELPAALAGAGISLAVSWLLARRS
jgi:O-antigen/teichoic acid export membrane protein